MRTNVKLPKFDTLVALYQKDPAAYEEFRKKYLNDEVASAPPQHRAALRETLSRIEIARQKARTPFEAATAAYTMMCESAIQLRAEIRRLHYATAGLQASLVIENARQGSFHAWKTATVRGPRL